MFQVVPPVFLTVSCISQYAFFLTDVPRAGERVTSSPLSPMGVEVAIGPVTTTKVAVGTTTTAPVVAVGAMTPLATVAVGWTMLALVTVALGWA